MSKLVLSKWKYHAKVLTSSALGVLIWRMIQTSEMFGKWTYLNIPVLDLSSLVPLFYYDVNPDEIEPLNVDFEFTLPKPEHTLIGIWGVFTRRHLPSIYPFLKSWLDFINNNIKEEYRKYFEKPRASKGYYGVSKYGASYYDPPAVEELLKSTFTRLYIDRKNPEAFARTLENMITTLNLSEEPLYEFLYRHELLMLLQHECLVLGLGVLSVSKLCREENSYGVIQYLTFENNIVEVKFSKLEDLMLGFILGITKLSYGFLIPRETIFIEKEDSRLPPYLELIASKTAGIVNRGTVHALAWFNYNSIIEQINRELSQRTEQWFSLRNLYKFIEEKVEHILAKILPDEQYSTVYINMYKSAVKQYVAFRVKRHVWGYRLYQAVDEETYKQLWLKNWVGQGLNRDVLLKLLEGIEPWIPRIQELREKLGTKVQKWRKRRAQLPVW